MRGKNHLCALCDKKFDRRQSCTNATVVGDDPRAVTLCERNVEVGAHEDAPTCNVEVFELFDRHSDLPTSTVRSTRRFE